eukprot:gene11104-13587_t
MKSKSDQQLQAQLQLDQFIAFSDELKQKYQPLLKSSTTTNNSNNINELANELTTCLNSFIQSTTTHQQFIQIKKIESATSKFIQKSTPDNSEINLESFKIIINILLDIVFLCGSRNVQLNRSIVNTINALVSVDKELNQIIYDRMDGLVQLVLSSSTIDIFKVSMISALLDITVFGDSVQQYIPKFIELLSSFVLLQCGDLERPGAVNITVSLHDCDQALRTIVTVFTKYSATVKSLLKQSTSTTTNNPLVNLLVVIIRLLKSPSCPKQLSTHSGFLIAETINLHSILESQSSEEFNIQSQILVSFFQPITINNQPIVSIFDKLLQQPTTKFLNQFKEFPEINQLSVLRGLCLTKAIDYIWRPIESSLRKVLFTEENRNDNLLLNFIFHSICQYCNSSMDQHNRLISLEYFYLCLCTIKDLLDTKTMEELFLISYEEFYKRYFTDSLNLVWKNWESTISPILVQVHSIFTLLLNIHFKCCGIDQEENSKLQSTQFLKNLTSKLIDEDWYQKGKYILLGILLEKVGPIYMINLKGNFIKNILEAMGDHTICNSAKNFLESFLDQLKMVSNGDISDSNSTTTLKKSEEYWIYPFLQVLTDADTVTCGRIIVYALPSLLKVFPESLFKVLAILGNQDSIDGNVKIRISLAVLNSARQLGLIDGRCLQADYFDLLTKALHHEEESLRLLALELICICPKKTERTTAKELELIKHFMLLNLKGASPFIRNQTLSTLFRFWVRLRDSTARVFRSHTNTNITIEKSVSSTDPYLEPEDVVGFVNWSSDLFINCLYPGAPFPRKMLPLDALSKFIDVWSSKANESVPSLVPFLEWINSRSSLFSKDSTSCLIYNLWDSYDRCRELSTEILLKFPSPLPGLESDESISDFLQWALKLSSSPKARECDTGALGLRIYFRKYVLASGLVPIFDSSSNSLKPFTFKKVEDREKASLDYVSQLVRVLRAQVKLASKSLLEASKHAPMHGLILTLRYILGDIELRFNSSTPVEKVGQWKRLVSEIIDLSSLISNIVLMVVANQAPEGNTPKLGMNDLSIPTSLPSGVIYDDDERLAYAFSTAIGDSIEALNIDDEIEGDGGDGGEEDEDDDQDFSLATNSEYLKGNIGQIITVCSWLCMKQISLLLGTILSRVDFPTAVADNHQNILSVEQIESIGNQFLTILMTSRHKGAIEKTYLGFQVLCSTLMKSSHPILYGLPSQWIDRLFNRVAEQSLHITRRSAGLPFAFIGILSGESSSHQKHHSLLHKVMNTLLNISEGTTTTNIVDSTPQDLTQVEKNIYLPQVHAINILKSIFRARSIIQELDQYLSRTLMTVIGAFGSPSWSVRNSSTMAFSVLVDRIIGTKRVKQDSSIINTTTFYHFFSRMPPLYNFLFKHFERSLEFITNKQGQEEEGSIVQSSIYAVLVLFSRLQPSSIDHPNDPLAPAKFIPLVSKCSVFSNCMVRQIAARALVPLVSTHDLVPFIQNLINQFLELKQDQDLLSEYNRGHGILLQIYQLIRVHLPTIQQKDRDLLILQLLDGNNSLGQLVWILKSRKNPPLAFVYYQILIELSKGSSTELLTRSKTIFESFTVTSDQILFQGFTSRDTQLPMFYIYIQMATEFYLQTVKSIGSSSESPKEITTNLIKLVDHQFYEVKEIAMKFLLDHPSTVDRYLTTTQSTINHLEKILFETMTNEKQQITCKKRAFKLFSYVTFSRTDAIISTQYDTETLFKLLDGYIWGKNIGIKTQSIVLFGNLYKYCFTMATEISPELFTSVTSTWIKMLTQFSRSYQPLEIRQSITKAIELSSSILNTTTSTTSTTMIIDMWLAITRLLEDDDLEIRSRCAVFTSNVFNKIYKRDNIIEVSKCLEEVIAYITREFGSVPYLIQNYMAMLNVEPFSKQFRDENEEIEFDIFSTDFKSPRVLFDKEGDNYFSEKLVIIQLISYHLELNLETIVASKKINMNEIQDRIMTTLLENTNWLKNVKQTNSLTTWNNSNRIIFGEELSSPPPGSIPAIASGFLNLYASSEFSADHGVQNSILWRMNRPGQVAGAWASGFLQTDQFIQASGNMILNFVGIAVQGRNDVDQWVEQFKIRYTVDGINWIWYNGGQEFPGVVDRYTPVIYSFPEPFKARGVQLWPTRWHQHMSLRWELYISPL